MISSSTTTTTSSSSVTVTSGSTSDGSVTGLDTYQLDLAVQSGAGSADGEAGMLVLTGGDATAVGENTVATADVTAWVSSGDTSSEAYASSTLQAAASSPDGTAYAGTSSYSDVYGGADRSFSLDFNESSLTLTDTTSTTTSVSISQDYALDIKSVTGTGSSTDEILSSGIPSLDLDLSGSDIASSGSEDCGCGDFDLALEGNLALADMDVLAYGADSLVEVEFSALAIEDQFSSVTVATLAAVA
jgi:hypothetical protein